MSDSIGVIGASVAGLHAAWLLARGGRDVRVYESSPRFDPVPRCLIVTGAIRDLLGDRVEPAVRNEVDRFELHAGGQVLEVPIDRPDLIIERAVLVRELARAASVCRGPNCLRSSARAHCGHRSASGRGQSTGGCSDPRK